MGLWEKVAIAKTTKKNGEFLLLRLVSAASPDSFAAVQEIAKRASLKPVTDLRVQLSATSMLATGTQGCQTSADSCLYCDQSHP